jgi:hypothetical protein
VKVVATGGPEMLTVHFEPSERGVLVDELRHLRSVITEATSRAHHISSASSSHSQTIDSDHEKLVAVCQLLDAVEARAATGQPLDVMAPTWLLCQIIRGSATEAVKRLVETLGHFPHDATPSRPPTRRHPDSRGE